MSLPSSYQAVSCTRDCGRPLSWSPLNISSMLFTNNVGKSDMKRLLSLFCSLQITLTCYMSLLIFCLQLIILKRFLTHLVFEKKILVNIANLEFECLGQSHLFLNYTHRDTFLCEKSGLISKQNQVETNPTGSKRYCG
jgi:hypothetical protein